MKNSCSYNQLLSFLVIAFDVQADRFVAFNSRVRNLQRLGFVRENSGKGNHREYIVSDVLDMAIALSFTNVGLPPLLVANNLLRGIAETGDYCIYIPEPVGSGRAGKFKCISVEDAIAALVDQSCALVDVHSLRGKIAAFNFAESA